MVHDMEAIRDRFGDWAIGLGDHGIRFVGGSVIGEPSGTGSTGSVLRMWAETGGIFMILPRAKDILPYGALKYVINITSPDGFPEGPLGTPRNPLHRPPHFKVRSRLRIMLTILTSSLGR